MTGWLARLLVVADSPRELGKRCPTGVCAMKITIECPKCKTEFQQNLAELREVMSLTEGQGHVAEPAGYYLVTCPNCEHEFRLYREDKP
jgi:hypothetical protein